MSSKLEKRLIFQKDLALLQCYASCLEIDYLIYSYYRTPEQQNKLYRAGKSNCDGYRRRSKHQDWLAVDLVVVNKDGSLHWSRDERYERLGRYWTEHRGNVWGGDWNTARFDDIYHFELGEKDDI